MSSLTGYLTSKGTMGGEGLKQVLWDGKGLAHVLNLQGNTIGSFTRERNHFGSHIYKFRTQLFKASLA